MIIDKFCVGTMELLSPIPHAAAAEAVEKLVLILFSLRNSAEHYLL